MLARVMVCRTCSLLMVRGSDGGAVCVCGGRRADAHVRLPAASEGLVGLPEDGLDGNIPHVLPSVLPPRLVLTEEQRRREHVLAAAVAIEFIRIAQPSDSRVTARYAASAVDNSRLLCAGSPRLHLSLLRGQLRWLRSLPVGYRLGLQ